jgi:hypothetical protein
VKKRPILNREYLRSKGLSDDKMRIIDNKIMKMNNADAEKFIQKL